ncbi:hypothetical protein ACOCJ7_10595 [Knoellia sp. CPCC 206453]|uniref:hypothetical protein n=1 Tax=Knoellia pratensis TaxID=3404796 RepID=UPI00360AE063
MKELPDALRALAAAQFNVVTRQQSLQRGLSKDAIRWNAGRHWRVILPNTYLLAPGHPSEQQRRMGALLYAGPSSALAGMTAAAVHGLMNANPRGRVDVVVPGSQASRQRGYATIRRSLLEDAGQVVRGGLRVSSLARACVDAAVDERSLRNRTALLVEAVQRNMTTVDDLAEWCYRLRSRDAAKVLPALDTAALGVWSVPEADVLDLMGSSALLPEPMTNPTLVDEAGRRLITPDLWLDDAAMAVMVHSKQYHADGEEFVVTVDRDGELVAAGVAVLAVTPTGVRRDPATVLARIEATYAAALQRPRPAVRAEPADAA